MGKALQLQLKVLGVDDEGALVSQRNASFPLPGRFPRYRLRRSRTSSRALP